MSSPAAPRRQWLVLAGGLALAPLAPAMTPVPGQTPPQPVNEGDSTATALGYVADARRVDRKRFPGYRDDQRCRQCALYKTEGPTCDTFAGRLIQAEGWCSVWKRKAK